MASNEKPKGSAPERKRGRPAAALPDREWATAEVERLTSLAGALDGMANETRRPPYAPSVARSWEKLARHARARLEEFQGGLPARFRADKPAQAYLELREAGGLDGPLREQRDQAFRDAVEAVRSYLVCRHVSEGDSAERILKEWRALRETLIATRATPRMDEPEEGREELAAFLPRLAEKADAACGRARALHLGRAATTIRGRFMGAIEALDTIGEWPAELPVLDNAQRSRAVFVVSVATGASIDTIKGANRGRE